MFFNEHCVAHFQAVYEDHKITDEIESGTVRGDFPPRTLPLVLEWADLHKQELQENWERSRRRQPLERVLEPQGERKGLVRWASARGSQSSCASLGQRHPKSGARISLERP